MSVQINPSLFLQTDGEQLPLYFPGALREQWLTEAAPLFARPILWLRHPATGLIHLWEIDAGEANLIRRIQDVGVSGLQTAELTRLEERGAIYDSERRARAVADLERAVAEAQSSVRRHGYAVIRDLLLPGYSRQIRRYYQQIWDQIKLGDRQVPKRKRKHNDVFCRVLHFDLYQTVSIVCEENVQSSFCYFSIYLPGSSLPRHTDRPQCRWNASMLLDSQPQATPERGWPIFVEGHDDQVRSATAGFGDIIIYNGINSPHWREEMPEMFEYQAICFFHFVLSEFAGPLA